MVVRVVLVAVVLALVGALPANATGQQQPEGDVREAVFVGNNWDGTATVLAPGSFEQLGRLNIIPDKEARFLEIAMNPEWLVYFMAIREAIGEGNNQYVDALRVKDGHEIGTFPSGGSPHESVYIRGGRKILHASIGTVYSPIDQGSSDPAKGERVFQLVDAKNLEVLRTYNLRRTFDRMGREDLSTAVRPMTLSPNERKVYFQLSFFHGFVKMDLRSGKINRLKRLPNLIKDTPREQYLLDSAHHGIAMNPRGTDICVAGTMSDYATVVDAKTFERGKLLKRKDGKPYWVTPSYDGRYCYISWSGTDEVSRIGYRSGRIDETVTVGDHPQRIRSGFVQRRLVRGLPDHAPADDVQSVPTPVG